MMLRSVVVAMVLTGAGACDESDEVAVLRSEVRVLRSSIAAMEERRLTTGAENGARANGVSDGDDVGWWCSDYLCERDRETCKRRVIIGLQMPNDGLTDHECRRSAMAWCLTGLEGQDSGACFKSASKCIRVLDANQVVNGGTHCHGVY